jgi:hypothetical protein
MSVRILFRAFVCCVRYVTQRSDVSNSVFRSVVVVIMTDPLLDLVTTVGSSKVISEY